MTPPTHEHARSSDDALSLRLGGDSVKKILGALLALLAVGGGVKGIYAALEKHNTDIAVLQASDERQEKKMDRLGEHLMGRKWHKE